ncbi:MAG: NYN domain-containing protein [Jatrophihabitans sp.]
MTDAESAAGKPTVLAEEPRRRVLEIAGQVLGRMPVEQVPASLRSIAKFTPGKRARLGGPALAAALETDEDFRNRVADVVVDTSAELVDALRSGIVPAAADPADVATVAYLVRPAGWADLVAAAQAPATARAESGAADAELTRLRAERDALKRESRGEPARLRLAIADAQQVTEVLRAELREVRAQLRAAQQAAENAVRDATDAQDAATRAERTREQEVRRIRGRLTSAERALEAARRTVRVDRSQSAARLAILVDSITAAAAGLRSELDLDGVSVRPADSVDAVLAPFPTGGGPSSERALDELLASPRAHVIVDGYNVTKTGYGQLPLAAQRARLVGELAALASARPSLEITVAFDGATGPPAATATPRGVRVLFSAADEIADLLIARLVEAEPRGRTVVVVSSDGEVAAHARAQGAHAAASDLLLTRLAHLR